MVIERARSYKRRRMERGRKREEGEREREKGEGRERGKGREGESICHRTSFSCLKKINFLQFYMSLITTF